MKKSIMFFVLIVLILSLIYRLVKARDSRERINVITRLIIYIGSIYGIYIITGKSRFSVFIPVFVLVIFRLYDDYRGKRGM